MPIIDDSANEHIIVERAKEIFHTDNFVRLMECLNTIADNTRLVSAATAPDMSLRRLQTMTAPEFFQTDEGIVIVTEKHSDEWVGVLITASGTIITRGPLNHLDAAEPMELINAQKASGFDETAQAVSFCLSDAHDYLTTLTRIEGAGSLIAPVVNRVATQLEALTSATRDLHNRYSLAHEGHAA